MNIVIRVLVMVAICFLTGCSSLVKNLYLGSVQPVSKAKIYNEISLDDFKKIVVSSPQDTRKLSEPVDMVIYEYQGVFVEYENEKHWYGFVDNKLVKEGKGTAKNALISIYFAYVDGLISEKKIGGADAERKKYSKYREVYPVSSYEDELFKYRIVIAGQLDRKEIDSDMADYLLAKKKNEIQANVDSLRSGAMLQDLVEAQRMQMIMQSLSSFRQTRCTSSVIGKTTYTNCY